MFLYAEKRNSKKNKIKRLWSNLNREFIMEEKFKQQFLVKKNLAIELKPRRKFYDYEAKYNVKAKTKHIIPVNLNKSTELMKISLKAHKLIGCEEGQI